MEIRTIGTMDFIFQDCKEEHGHFTILTRRIDENGKKITYMAKIRRKEKSAFEDLRDNRGGIHGATYFKKLYSFNSDSISLWYSADVGRCCSIWLYQEGEYSQGFYYSKIDYDYTHDFMITEKYRKNKIT